MESLKGDPFEYARRLKLAHDKMIVHNVTIDDLNPPIVNALLNYQGSDNWLGLFENYLDRAYENKIGRPINYSTSPEIVKALIKQFGFKQYGDTEKDNDRIGFIRIGYRIGIIGFIWIGFISCKRNKCIRQF